MEEIYGMKNQSKSNIASKIEENFKDIVKSMGYDPSNEEDMNMFSSIYDVELQYTTIDVDGNSTKNRCEIKIKLK